MRIAASAQASPSMARRASSSSNGPMSLAPRAARRLPVRYVDPGTEPHFDQLVEFERDDGLAHGGP
jgi:hypothetical protein